MADGLIGHYIGANYVRVSRLESAKLCHKEGMTVTWDIGVPYNELEDDVKNFYKNNGYMLFKDKQKSTKYTFVTKEEIA